eukprot:s1386_g2.t1
MLNYQRLCLLLKPPFFLTSEDTQIVVGLRTNPASDLGRSGSGRPLSVVEMAVQRHSFSDPNEDPSLVYFRSNRKIFNTFVDRDMEAEVAAWAFCIESNVLQPSGDPLIDPLVQVLLRTAAASLGYDESEASALSCAALSNLCDQPEARLLRFVCGLTCGCADPLASPWHKVPNQGCHDLCTELAAEAHSSCTDIATGDGSKTDRVWQFYFETYPDMMTAFYGSNVSTSSVYPLIASRNAQMKQLGCPALLQPELQMEFATTRPRAWTSKQRRVVSHLRSRTGHFFWRAAPILPPMFVSTTSARRGISMASAMVGMRPSVSVASVRHAAWGRIGAAEGQQQPTLVGSEWLERCAPASAFVACGVAGQRRRHCHRGRFLVRRRSTELEESGDALIPPMPIGRLVSKGSMTSLEYDPFDAPEFIQDEMGGGVFSWMPVTAEGSLLPDNESYAEQAFEVPVDRLEYLQGSGFLEAKVNEDFRAYFVGEVRELDGRKWQRVMLKGRRDSVQEGALRLMEGVLRQRPWDEAVKELPRPEDFEVGCLNSAPGAFGSAHLRLEVMVGQRSLRDSRKMLRDVSGVFTTSYLHHLHTPMAPWALSASSCYSSRAAAAAAGFVMSKRPLEEVATSSVGQGPRPPKAYKNNDFLNSTEARLIRIMCELEEPKDRLRTEGVDNIVMFFGSARAKPRDQYEAAVKEAEAKVAANPGDAKLASALSRLKKQEFLVLGAVSAMGGAPYTVVVYKNAIVMLAGSSKTGHTLDAAAVQRCHEIARGTKATAEDPQAVENAVGDMAVDLKWE